MLTFEDRAQIAVGIQRGLSDREIGKLIGRDHTVVWRERVLADLKRSRTPRQIAGRLRLEATDTSVGVMKHSPSAGGATVSHEAIYTWIYAHTSTRLAELGVFLQSRRTRHTKRRVVGERKGTIVGMVSIDERPDHVAGRRVPGAWEGDLIVGKNGASVAATLVERTSRFVIIKALPDGKKADALADVLIDTITGFDKQVFGSLTWDQGTEMARHAALTVATDMPVYFAHPHSPWERPTNENTNRLIREYLPKGTEIPAHQPYLDAIADELNDRPRATLGYLTPREVFTQQLLNNVATTT